MLINGINITVSEIHAIAERIRMRRDFNFRSLSHRFPHLKENITEARLQLKEDTKLAFKIARTVMRECKKNNNMITYENIKKQIEWKNPVIALESCLPFVKEPEREMSPEERIEKKKMAVSKMSEEELMDFIVAGVEKDGKEKFVDVVIPAIEDDKTGSKKFFDFIFNKDTDAEIIKILSSSVIPFFLTRLAKAMIQVGY